MTTEGLEKWLKARPEIADEARRGFEEIAAGRYLVVSAKNLMHVSLTRAKKQVYRLLHNTSPRDEIEDAEEELWRAGLLIACLEHGERCVLIEAAPND